jgi:hypothetical protein
MVLPRHPGQDEQISTPRSRGTKFVIVAVAFLLAAMVILHLTGVIHH